jgi:hypothetical protein
LSTPYSVVIIVGKNETRSVYPEVPTTHFDDPEARTAAVNFVKGAVLHCIGDWKNVPDQIHFKVVGVCHYCKVVIPDTKTAQCCITCADERGP